LETRREYCQERTCQRHFTADSADKKNQHSLTKKREAKGRRVNERGKRKADYVLKKEMERGIAGRNGVSRSCPIGRQAKETSSSGINLTPEMHTTHVKTRDSKGDKKGGGGNNATLGVNEGKNVRCRVFSKIGSESEGARGTVREGGLGTDESVNNLKEECQRLTKAPSARVGQRLKERDGHCRDKRERKERNTWVSNTAKTKKRALLDRDLGGKKVGIARERDKSNWPRDQWHNRKKLMEKEGAVSTQRPGNGYWEPGQCESKNESAEGICFSSLEVGKKPTNTQINAAGVAARIPWPQHQGDESFAQKIKYDRSKHH